MTQDVDLAAFSQKIGDISDDTVRSHGIAGIPTGFGAIDEALGGLEPGNLILIGSRPSMGKTALALSIARNVAGMKRLPVQVFALEATRVEVKRRLLAQEARVGIDELKHGRVLEVDREGLENAKKTLAPLPIFIDDAPALTIPQIRDRALALKQAQGALTLIVVDYLQLVRPEEYAGFGNRTLEISEVTKGLKAIAKECEAPVVALSQLSRAVEQRDDPRPKLLDLRDSGSLEEDADVILFVHREEYFLERAEPRRRPGQNDEMYNRDYARWTHRLEEAHRIADVIIAKQRCGPIGSFQLVFTGEYSDFADMEYRENLEMVR